MSNTQEVIHQIANGVNFGGFHESPFGGAIGLGFGAMGVAGTVGTLSVAASALGVNEAMSFLTPSLAFIAAGGATALSGAGAQIISAVTVNQTNTLTTEERGQCQNIGAGLVLVFSMLAGIGTHNMMEQKIQNNRATTPKTTVQSASPVASSASAPVAAP